MFNYIHCHQPFDTNKGGTVGYLSQLLLGMQELETFTSSKGVRHGFIFPEENKATVVDDGIKDFSKFGHIYQYAEDANLAYCTNYSNQFHSLIPYTESIKIKFHQINSIHIHGAYNFLPIYNLLKKVGIEKDVIKILTTHNPWKPELEDLEYMAKNGSTRQICSSHTSFFSSARDKFAFENCDALFFPCENSMEGYFRSWPEFSNIVKKKKIFFSLTGARAKPVTTPASFMRKHLRIPDSAIVYLYLGRFMDVRGFDIFVEAAKKVLSIRNDIYFIAVGEHREVPAVSHPYWIEIPFTTSPGDYLCLADACIASNRGSFFDLSMIEILASGTPIIASKVGGYKWLETKTSGVIYFESEKVEDLTQKILEFSNTDSSIKDKMHRDNIELYRNKLTISHFADGYMNTFDDIYDSFKLKPIFRRITPPVYGEPVQVTTMDEWFKASASITTPAKQSTNSPLTTRYKAAPQWRKVISLLLLDQQRLKTNIRTKYPNNLYMLAIARLIPADKITTSVNSDIEQRYKTVSQWRKVTSLLLLDRQRLKDNIRKRYKYNFIMLTIAKYIPS